MTLRRFIVLFLVAFTCEVGLFAASYRDLLHLRRGDRATTDAADVFRPHAEHALTRARLTRSHLETIATGALSLRLTDLEIDALERLSRDVPSDRGVRLRLADALRRAGRYDRAESLLLDLLDDRQDVEDRP